MNPTLVEVNFSSQEESKEDKIGGDSVIWKDILREGEFAITPGLSRKEPFKVIAAGQSDPVNRIISMSDIISAADDKAFEDITIPDGHPKSGGGAINNTGYARALRIVKKKGKHYLQAAMGFTEPEVAAKVRRGTVPNVSSGVLLGFTRKSDGKYFPAALNHIALTRTPWIDDLEPFKRVFAADDEDLDVQVVEFDDGEDQTNKAEVVWNDEESAAWVQKALTSALEPEPVAVEDGRPFVPRPSYFVQNVARTKDLALVTEYFKGQETEYVIPFSVADGKVTPAPSTRWVEGQRALIAASDDEPVSDGFEDFSVEKVAEKLGVALSDMVDNDSFSVEQVTLDNRVRIKDKVNKVTFVAKFSLLDNGSVFIASPNQWERVSTLEADQTSPEPTSKKITEVILSDTGTTPDAIAAEARIRIRRKYPELFTIDS